MSWRIGATTLSSSTGAGRADAALLVQLREDIAAARGEVRSLSRGRDKGSAPVVLVAPAVPLGSERIAMFSIDDYKGKGSRVCVLASEDAQALSIRERATGPVLYMRVTVDPVQVRHWFALVADGEELVAPGEGFVAGEYVGSFLHRYTHEGHLAGGKVLHMFSLRWLGRDEE